MADRSTSTDKILIDPLFVLPPGAEDYFVHARENSDTDIYVPDGEESAYSSDEEFDFLTDEDFESDDGFEDDNAVDLETPENFYILSQTLRRAPGGQQVVDIVIDTEDVEGAINYEIQVAKV